MKKILTQYGVCALAAALMVPMAQAHLTRPGLTDLDRCPVQNLGAASLPNLNRMRHQRFHKSINSLLFITEN